MEDRAMRSSATVSYPQMRAVPDVLRTSPARILMMVDLPAPFGPSSPKNDPRGIPRFTASKALRAG